jgi:hypothetical protein
MSATNRGAIRKANDGYATPGWCVDRLLERVALPGGHWIEPCAGHGAIINRVESQRNDVEWSAIEIRPEHLRRLEEYRCRALRIGNFLELASKEHAAFWPRYDVAITNPPYHFAKQFVQACLPMAKVVAMLLRVNLLASEERQPWLTRSMPDVYVLPNRPDFTGGGGDATEYAWMLFYPGDRRRGSVEVLDITPAAERKRERARLRAMR